jgi:polyhydroxybutyrate depolymerase
MRNRRRHVLLFFVFALLFALMLGPARFGRFVLRAFGQSGDKSGTLEIDGRTRNYFVHAPRSYDHKTPLPVVLVLHGATQSAESAERMSGMSAKADKEMFLAVYPSGIGRVPTWNAGACCGPAMEQKVDDVAFFRALLAKLESEYSIDSKRVFVTGISNGAMMSYRLACEMSERIAAISPVEGAQDIPCHPANPVALLVFHGTADHLVPFDGGSTPFQMGSKRSDTSVADTVAFWVKEDGCKLSPEHGETAAVHTDIYSGCKYGTAVALYAIQGGHHMWPGLQISGNDIPATDLMWTFFAAHPKP